MILTFAVIIFAVLLVSGAPIFMAFAIGGLMIITLHTGLPLYNIGIFFFDSIDNWIMLAVPLFMFAGQLMLESGMGKILVDALRSFIGRIPGSIAISAIVASAFVGALAGQNLAVLGSVGVVLFPSMMEAGYDKGYSGGVLCSSSQLGFLIPPSVVFIIYGFLTQTSVAKLFMAGIIPGIILSIMLIIAAIFIARKRRFPPMPELTRQERKFLLLRAIPSLLMPVIILGGIYGGVFTPTEAAAVACIYTLVVGIFIYRSLTWKRIWNSAIESAQLTGIIMILFCGVMLLGRAMTLIGLPQTIGEWVVSGGLTQNSFLLMLCIAFVILGMVMDAFAMVVVLPVVMPAVRLLGIDSIHLGVVFVVASMIGTMTPPASAAIYFTSSLFNIPTAEAIKGVLPFLAVMVLFLFILAFFPIISIWLPRMMF
ncbi:MAG: TRAP transporter large permease [Deltaproteobacteria bacterium]|nr:TRAP transporter large permease [Deltaproteobacteria bacterium]